MKASARGRKVNQERHFVVALARGLSVLACFRSNDNSLSNQELARRCRLPKSTISRLTHTLTRLGYLQHADQNARYRLGTATLALGSTMLARIGAKELARPLMQELADATGTVVAMGIYAHLHMIYVETCRSGAPVTISLDIGARLPVATTAMGRAYLAAISPEERAELMTQLRAVDRTNWSRTRAGIDVALKQYARLGCCGSFGDWQKDLNGIGVAINPGGGMPVLSISCGGPAFQLPPAFLLDVARPRLIDMVRRLEAMLAVASE